MSRKTNTLPEGYKWFNGVTLNPLHTKQYNNFTRDIKRAIKDGFEHLADEIEHQRHRHLILTFEVYLNK